MCGMLETGGLEDRRCSQGSGRDDHGPGADDELARHAALVVGDGRHDAGRPAVLEHHASDAGVRDHHRPGGGRIGEMDTDPGPLGPTRATEAATAAVAAGIGVAARRSRLPAERPGATQEDRVLRRDVGGLGDAELGFDGGDVARPGLAGHPLEAVLGRPFGADVLGRRDAGRPVDERPATDAGASEHGHGAVPGRRQAVVEVQAVEPVELRARHGGLVGERTGFEDDDEPTGARQRCRDDTAACP